MNLQDIDNNVNELAKVISKDYTNLNKAIKEVKTTLVEVGLNNDTKLDKKISELTQAVKLSLDSQSAEIDTKLNEFSANGWTDELVKLSNGRTQRDKNTDIVSVKDFGAVGDGVTDDTAAIQACTNAVGVVRFPEGQYLISDTIVQKFSGQKFIGVGVNPYNDSTQGATRIIMTNPVKTVFKSSGTGFTANSLNITYSKTPTEGCAFDIQHSGSFIHEVWIDKCYRGFAYSRNTGHALSNCNVQSAYYAAFSVDGTNDVAVNNCIFVSADLSSSSLDKTKTCPNGVTLFENYVQAVQMTNVDILGGAKSIGIVNTANNISELPKMTAFCKFTNVYFDSSFYGADVDKCLGMTFVNCWFSNRPGEGCVVGTNFCDNTKFIGCNFENCGGSGVVLKKGSSNTHFLNCSFLGNSTSVAGGSHGIFVDKDTNDFSIIGCVSKNVPYFGNSNSQNYGLFINGGATKRFNIIGNDFTGNNNSKGFNVTDFTFDNNAIIAHNKPSLKPDFGGLSNYLRQSIAIAGGDPNRAVVDIVAQNTTTTFIDNVVTLQNKTTNGTIYGNAAIGLLDGAGNERGAIGYSRNSSIQPDGFSPDTVYIECGDPFVGDNNPSSFKVMCNLHPKSPFTTLGNLSYVPIEHDTKTGTTFIRGRGDVGFKVEADTKIDGQVLIGQINKSPGADGQLSVTNNSSVTPLTLKSNAPYQFPVQIIYHSATSGNNNFLTFATDSDYTPRASITYNRGAGQVAYNTTSDYRAKTVHGDVNDALSIVNQMHVVDATMIDATQNVPMFIAHELQAIAPYAVSGDKDAVDDNGNPIYQQVDSSKLIPLLVKAVQELHNKVNQ